MENIYQINLKYISGISGCYKISYLNSQTSDVIVLQTFINKETETERFNDHILYFPFN